MERFAREKPDVKWAGLFGAGGENKTYGFEKEISLHNVSAHRNDELVAIHHPSGTLLEGDMLFNLPPTEQYSRSHLPAWFRVLLGSGSSMSPGGTLHNKLADGLFQDKEKAKREMAPIFEAEWDRIIPCHGDVIESGGKAKWNEVWAKYAPSVSVE